MNGRRVVLATCALLVLPAIGSCSRAAPPAGPGTAPLALAKVWPRPPSAPPEHRFRADGEGPFPPSWPTIAFVGRTETQVECDPVCGNGTLFIACAPDLTPDSDVLDLLANAGLAERCNLFALPFSDGRGPLQPCYGAWVQMAGLGAEAHFVFVDASGGTSGRRVRVYHHGVAFGAEFQHHTFERVLWDDSRVPVYVGDADDDGCDELLIGSVETNSSGAAGTPQVYRIMKWSSTSHAMEEAGRIDASNVHDAPCFTVLSP